MNYKIYLYLLKHLHSDYKNNQQGSIVLKLIFGIVILTIPLMFLMPNLLGGCTNKAKQAEAKNIVRTMNRAQQAYFLENKSLAKSIPALELGIKEQTENYIYSIKADKNSTFHYAIARHKNASIFNRPTLKNYVSAVFLDPNHKDKEGLPLTITIACETNTPSHIEPPRPTFNKGVATCSQGTTNLPK